ncbi:UDP-N-acetylmuramoyl-L-alanine--D-glutamate ligase [Bartonella tamiae]|uniref:UDP-N-acetylmuramoylalanine--D-glutamate ligase n=1 Tax=Bartonella tamiae Th239 TaxID=1094558 RepID=J1JVS2_9HYPH|nr:UDP-N-acetylmuramoyl-L-alanine--D-glutamate ligase [Bartonella tamiae]EJF89067.1 UDP-N-acetylmuramoylalanine-D-glutamate ligase [Bartonella tamiae Th239]EJF94683.1 UDP-N-acetylmuramoylalanine-D-glutamate ligase [Bartonella tamiae Th307]
MIVLESFKNKRVALFGLGGSGIATLQALICGGADVFAWDDKEEVRRFAKEQLQNSIIDTQNDKASLNFIENAADQYFNENHGCLIFQNLRELDWTHIDVLILAPGVPLTHPTPHWVVTLAQKAQVDIIGDIELFVRERTYYLKKHSLKERDIPFIAITGTNGKSTTTAFIDHLLKIAGQDVQMGGNIGTAILALEPFKKNRIYVVECSSFQIDLAPSLNPTIGILLNLSPDHIDRHGSFAHYNAIKKRLIAKAHYALIGIEEKETRAIYDALKSKNHKIYPISKKPYSEQKKIVNFERGYFLDHLTLYELNEVNNHIAKKRVSLKNVISLRGSHNAQNAMMGLACLDILNLKLDNIDAAFSSYQGLPHRMQQVRKIGSVLFVNDSKATNAEASAPALATFEHIYWIIGGVAKEGGISALKDFFPKIKKAYLIGDAADDFAKTIGDAFAVSKSKTLEKAVHEAAKDAAFDSTQGLFGENGEGVVLLSPASASYDQFKNYGARGDAFITLVNEL